MARVSPRPVKPRPTRRLLAASCCWRSSGQWVASSTLSSMRDEQGQVDRTQAAATVRRQRLFGAGIGRLDDFAVIEVVVLVHAVEEQDARLGVVVGRLHDLVPQVAGAHLAIDPQAVFTLVGAGRA